jgi:hypothetical protein
MLCLNVALGQLILIHVFVLMHVHDLILGRISIKIKTNMIDWILLDIILRVGGCGVGGVAEV